MLGLRASDIACDLQKNTAVISLGLTKSGSRAGAAESSTVASDIVVPMLAVLCAAGGPSKLLYTSSAAAYRRLFDDCCRELGLEDHNFKPYSLRRGGATEAFERSANISELMIRGRWQNIKTALIYLNSGLAALAMMRLSPQTLSNVRRSTQRLRRVLGG